MTKVGEEPKLPFQIFGRWIFKKEEGAGWAIEAMREAGLPLPADWVGIGQKELENLCPFKVDPHQWNVAINDCWLLGGVNSLQEFYPASPVTWQNILCPDHIVTVTGRELIGLALAGYEERSGHAALGKVYVPGGDRAKAKGLSLVNYDREVSNLKDGAAVRGFFQGKNFVIG
jgi:hypothetical protein